MIWWLLKVRCKVGGKVRVVLKDLQRFLWCWNWLVFHCGDVLRNLNKIKLNRTDTIV